MLSTVSDKVLDVLSTIVDILSINALDFISEIRFLVASLLVWLLPVFSLYPIVLSFLCIFNSSVNSELISMKHISF